MMPMHNHNTERNCMEIGGYRELDLRTGFEYYTGNKVARLNSGRAGIFHAVKCCGCRRVLLPYYECSTVMDFLQMHEMEIIRYHIDKEFRPILTPSHFTEDTAIVIVNYFGMMARDILKDYAARFSTVIIDNTQAFYSRPIQKAYCVYSPRKFFGVADGCYVIGNNALKGIEEYPLDHSEDTASFLLRRIESGGNNNYQYYLENEKRIDESGPRRMSRLTHKLLDNIDYAYCAQKRRENFSIAHSLFKDMNLFPKSLVENVEDDFVPMVYPLVVEDASLRGWLKENGIFVGQWWKYLLHTMDPAGVEYYYAQNMYPIQIDQRYSEEHLLFTKKVVDRCIGNGRLTNRESI